jgi:hypothetical protein
MRIVRPTAVLLALIAISTSFADPTLPPRLIKASNNECTRADRSSCDRQRTICKMVVFPDNQQQQKQQHDASCESDFNACLVTAGCRN